MNIEDRIHEAMLRARWSETECDRCGIEPAIIAVNVSLIETEMLLSSSQLCRACHTDYCWFMTTPPEQPDISSDTLPGTKESE